MKTLDLKRQFKALYGPSAKHAELISVPKLQFVMIDGAIEKGLEPGSSPGFQEATQAIYGISYTMKFMLKKRKSSPVDYPVMALEGLWWVEDRKFDIRIKDNWQYTLMIMQPKVITPAVFRAGLQQIRQKRGQQPALDRLRLATYDEGLCAQIMHVGPYAAEPSTVDNMVAFAEANGYRDRVGRGGKHHEIYLGDPRKARPEKLKTVLRHPVEEIR